MNPTFCERIAKVLLPKDYLRLWLTGGYHSDKSDSAGTAWLDTGKRVWSKSLLDKTGLSHVHMPALVDGSDVTGKLRAEIVDRWGLSGDCVVAGGGGDNAASAIGAGVTEAGEAFVSLGTSGVLFAACDAYTPGTGDGGAHILPRPAAHMAPDGRDPVGDRCAELVCRAHLATKPCRADGRAR
jgi:xylulokinase